MGKEFFNKGEQLIKDNYDSAVEGVEKSKRIEKGKKDGGKINAK